MFNIQEELKKLPTKPGVYLMKDEFDHIIYVGKAIILRNRVRQYFRKSTNHSTKIKQLVEHIVSFEYIVTDSELEALILECNLIKKHRPKYNTMLKDDKTYPYIKVTSNEDFPRVFTTREVKKDGAKYFGPYTSGLAAKESIEVLRQTFKVRTCSRVLPRDIGKERACLYYHIGQCDGPCIGEISKGDYSKKTEGVVSFLNGHYEDVAKIVEKKMTDASENLEFEKAAEYRNQLQSIRIIAEKQKISNALADDQDVIAFAKNEDKALVQVYFVRNGKMIGREHFNLDRIQELTDEEIMTEFVKQFYGGTPFIPKEIVMAVDILEKETIQEWLSNKRGFKVTLTIPQKGSKFKLVNLARNNANLTLKQFGEQMRKKEAKTKGAMKELVSLLGIEEDCVRIEAYDISNTSGFESVGSMVVFEEGQPKKSDYRKFKIKGVKGPDDYRSLEEVLTRRFNRAIEEQKEILLKGLNNDYGKFSKLPDLVLMDGGKGQVTSAKKVMKAVGLEIPVCGMVKDNHHNTRGLFFEGMEIPINKKSESFYLITRIQDEAHRFAIDFHKKLRSKKQIHSVLDDIDGIGPKRRKQLLRAFGTIEAIKEATVEELCNIEGMNQKVAETVYNFFK